MKHILSHSLGPHLKLSILILIVYIVKCQAPQNMFIPGWKQSFREGAMEVWGHHLWDSPMTSYRFFGTIKAPVKDTITASYQVHGTITPWVSWTKLDAVRVSGVMKLDAAMVSWTKLDAVRVSGVMKSDAVMVSSTKLDAVTVSGVMKLDAVMVSSTKLDAVRVSWNTEEQTPLCLRSPRFTSGDGDLPLGAAQCCFLKFFA